MSELCNMKSHLLGLLVLLCWVGIHGHFGEDARFNAAHALKTWSNRSNFTQESIDVILSKGFQDRYDVAIDLHRGKEACETEVLTRISPSNYTDQLSKMFSGPDEFIFFIEGKELISYVPKYVGCGRYHASFHLLLSGAYHFKLIRLRSNFTALNEYEDLYPRIHYETLVADWIELVGSKSKSASCHHIHYGAWIQKSLAPKSAAAGATSIYDSLKTAEAIPPITYRNGDDRKLSLTSYIPHGSEHASKGCLNNLDLYSYEPVTGCHWDHISQDEASKILSGKRIALSGDSHMRTFGNMLLKWACDINNPFAKGMFTKFTVNNETTTKCRAMSISYSANYYCASQDFTWNGVPEDIILANCGHHPASSEHTPVETYKEMLINYVKHANLTTSGISHKNFIWLESNPEPLRDDGYVVDSKDWRTQHRLLMYNQIANNIFLRHNYTVMYQYQSFLPFVESMCDYAHFTAAGSYYPLFMQFLHIVKNRS